MLHQLSFLARGACIWRKRLPPLRAFFNNLFVKGNFMEKINPPPLAILRLDELMRRSGIARSTVYKMVQAGELPPPVRLFGTATGWPEKEIDSVLNARIAGQTPKEIRTLVGNLVAARKTHA